MSNTTQSIWVAFWKASPEPSVSLMDMQDREVESYLHRRARFRGSQPARSRPSELWVQPDRFRMGMPDNTRFQLLTSTDDRNLFTTTRTEIANCTAKNAQLAPESSHDAGRLPEYPRTIHIPKVVPRQRKLSMTRRTQESGGGTRDAHDDRHNLRTLRSGCVTSERECAHSKR